MTLLWRDVRFRELPLPDQAAAALDRLKLDVLDESRTWLPH